MSRRNITQFLAIATVIILFIALKNSDLDSNKLSKSAIKQYKTINRSNRKKDNTKGYKNRIIKKKKTKANRMRSNYEDQLESEDIDKDLDFAYPLFNRYIHNIISERIGLSEKDYINYLNLKRKYEDESTVFIQDINKDKDKQRNIDNLINLRKKYEINRNKLLGKSNVKTIKNHYIKEFNKEYSKYTKNPLRFMGF